MSNNEPKRLMLMFTIGPVQSFIEAARKTEDLWMGSYILSYLVATAMDKIQGDGAELIYPAIGSESPFKFWKEQNLTTPSFPNLFLAIGNGIEQAKLEERARCAEASVKTDFNKMAECAVDAAFDDWRGTYAECVFNRQISDFFDVYWVITEEADKAYGDWYDYTASSLAAIKNCRAFEQISEFGRKCSLDGTREIVHLKKGHDEHDQIKKAMEWWEKFAERKPQFCRQKEALCAVSLTKRMGRHYLRTKSIFKDEFHEEFSSGALSFPSTSEVATADFKKEIVCKPETLEVYSKLCKAVKQLRQSDDEEANIPTVQSLPKIKCPLPNNVDGEWLYEETYNDSYLERYYNVDVLNEKDRIERCKGLRSQLVGLLEGEPGKYYAAIALDADNMGEVNRKAENREQHQANSKQLIEYSKTARQIVEEKHLGKLTYAGGDDLLALANLNDLLPMLSELREEFPKFTTASVGVCIAHNKTPLGDVLRQARRMEQSAKSKGRDSLGIVLFKRSGNVSEVVSKWKHGDLEVLTIGQEFAKLLDDNEISKGFLYTFRDIFTKLIGDDGKLLKGIPSVIVKEEFKRLIERAHTTQGLALDSAKQDTICKTISLLSRITPFTEYLSFLEIVNFVARESK